MTKPTPAAVALAEKTADAYSADRYNSWPAVAQCCFDMGYNERQAEAIMRSKYARWAADGHCARYGKIPASALRDMRDRSPAMFGDKAISDLVSGTF